ncbi:MAG: hypothetical protein LR001_03185 [Clostridiales bacterium]|nr:hypothetical protein [Clostridiales bacterium]
MYKFSYYVNKKCSKTKKEKFNDETGTFIASINHKSKGFNNYNKINGT